MIPTLAGLLAFVLVPAGVFVAGLALCDRLAVRLDDGCLKRESARHRGACATLRRRS